MASEFPDSFVRGIVRENPWWTSSKDFFAQLPEFKRSDFHHYLKELDESRIDVIVGPRRVGKTILLNQLIKELILNRGVNPRNILFVSLERTYFELVDRKLESALEYFEELVLKKSLTSLDERVYIFVDEAQYDSSWSKVFKEFIDQKRNAHVFVSGSSAVSLKTDGESGAGRFNLHQMVTLKFRDALMYRHYQKDDSIRIDSIKLRTALVKSLDQNNLKVYYDALTDFNLTYSEEKPKIYSCLEEYFLKGGYIEFYSTDFSWNKISKYYQQNVFDVILQKDVVNNFNIRLPLKLRKLMVIICEYTSKTLSRQKLNQRLKLQALTLDSYFEALSEAFLIRISSKYTPKNFPSTKERKYYVGDVGIRNAILGLDDVKISNTQRGDIIETVIFNHALRLSYHLDGNVITSGYYWEDDAGERDIVINLKGKYNVPIPIEVKSGQCSKGDIAKMKNTIHKTKARFGIIVCKQELNLVDNVLIMPQWLFCLSC